MPIPSTNSTLKHSVVLAMAAYCASAFAQTGLATIQDTLFKADGTRFSGTLTIHWGTFDLANAGTIVQQSRNVDVVNGNLQVHLTPNAGAPAPANTYTVTYVSNGRDQFTETWTVPPGSQPLRVADVRTGTLAVTPGSAGNQTPVVESTVVGLVADLALRPIKGPGFGTGSVATINQNGQIETVTGNVGDCVYADGTTGPCGGQASVFYDSETPAGLVDGVNATFTLLNAPSGHSLALFRNGMYMKADFDYTLADRTVQFVPGIVPQPLDTLVANYRIDPDSVLSNLRASPVSGSVPAQVLCSAGGRATTHAVPVSLGGCDIPAAALRPGDRIEIRFAFAHTGSTSDFDVQVNWGGTTALTRHGNARDTAVVGQADAAVGAVGVQLTTQSWGTLLPFLPGIVSAAAPTGLQVTFLGALTQEGADSLGLTNYTVLRYPGN